MVLVLDFVLTISCGNYDVCLFQPANIVRQDRPNQTMAVEGGACCTFVRSADGGSFTIDETPKPVTAGVILFCSCPYISCPLGHTFLGVWNLRASRHS